MDGNKLKSMRMKKNISLTKLSELSSISKSYLSLIERDIQKNPSLEILEKLARTFEIEVDELVGKKDKSFSHNKSVKSILKIEIELSEDQLCPQKIKQIKDFISAINTV